MDDGFYWVKFNDEWITARYYSESKSFWLAGYTVCFILEEFEAIIKKQIDVKIFLS